MITFKRLVQITILVSLLGGWGGEFAIASGNFPPPLEYPDAPFDLTQNPFEPDTDEAPARRPLPTPIADTLSSEQENQFQTLSSILKLAQLDEELNQPGFFILFAPTEQAFDEINDKLTQLLLSENREQLIQWLKNHVVQGNITEAELNAGEVKTLGGEIVNLKVTNNGENVIINNTIANKKQFIRTPNGLIVPIDQVLFLPN